VTYKVFFSNNNNNVDLSGLKLEFNFPPTLSRYTSSNPEFIYT